MIGVLAGVVTSLASKGLGYLSDAVVTKGKEKVEELLGVKLDNLDSPEKIAELKRLEFEHEEVLVKMALEEKKLDYSFLEKSEEEISHRWVSDNEHGTWFSKIVRPLILAVLTISFILLAFLDGNGLQINPSYAPIFQTLLMTVYGAYFGLKTLERVKGGKP
jgi:hypothetical protein